MSDYSNHRNENTIELPTIEDVLFCLRLTGSILFRVYHKKRNNKPLLVKGLIKHV